jgi:hypothetical protein
MKRLLLLLLILFVIPNALAMGVSPGLVKYDYEPGKTLEIPFTIRSTSNTPGYALISVVEGPLAEFATVNKEEVFLNPRAQDQVTLTINLPHNLELYGVQAVRLEITQKPEEGGFLSVTTGVRARAEIQFPYPNRYIELRGLSANPVGEGQNLLASWSIINLGKEPINYQTNIWILDSGTELIRQQLPQKTILPDQTIQDNLEITTIELKPGSYTLFKELIYDDQKIILDRTIRIGEKKIELISLTKNFKPNTINEFKISLRNEWNEEFREVVAELKIGDKTARTNQARITPYPSQQTFTGYIDTTGLNLGEQKAEITITFKDLENQLITQTINTSISIDDAKEPSTINWLIVSLVTILIVVLVGAGAIIYSLIKEK